MYNKIDSFEVLKKSINIELPSLSVIVAFRKSERCILDCLQSIYAMDYPHSKLEVIVVDDWHDNVTAEMIGERFPKVKLIRNDIPLGCDSSKQKGIDAATGGIIALTDADCMVHPHWGRAIAKNLADGAGAVTGPIKHPKTFFRELIAVADFRDSQSEKNSLVDAFPGCNFAVRREEFQHIKYDRSGEIRGGSDRLVSWYLYSKGRRISYDPAVQVCHSPAVNIRSLLERRSMYGKTALGLRRLDPTLPGSIITRLGPLAAPTYICYKVVKDTYRLLEMAINRVINPWHVPLLFPSLIVFRLLDATGMIGLGSMKRSRGEVEEASHDDEIQFQNSKIRQGVGDPKS